jgi:hypothetical protein
VAVTPGSGLGGPPGARPAAPAAPPPPPAPALRCFPSLPAEPRLPAPSVPACLLPSAHWAASYPLSALACVFLQAARRALHFPESAARRLSLEAVLRWVAARASSSAVFREACLKPAWCCVVHSGMARDAIPEVHWVLTVDFCPGNFLPHRGHSGCVNRLCWNESGSLLASASDDRKVGQAGRQACVGVVPASSKGGSWGRGFAWWPRGS